MLYAAIVSGILSLLCLLWPFLCRKLKLWGYTQSDYLRMEVMEVDPLVKRDTKRVIDTLNDPHYGLISAKKLAAILKIDRDMVVTVLDAMEASGTAKRIFKGKKELWIAIRKQ